MFAALALARDILALAPEAIELVKLILRTVQGHSRATQREALDAAFAAVETTIVRRFDK